MKKYIIIQLLFFVCICYSQNKIICADSVKIKNLKDYFDFYSHKDNYFGFTQMRKLVDKSFFECTDKKIDKILINIETTADGSYVIEKHSKYKPRKNEILFLLEDDDREFVRGGQQINFRIGNKIRKAIFSKKLNPMSVVVFLKCKVLKLKIVPEDDYLLESFEKEINRE